jgi:hypothetical protein
LLRALSYLLSAVSFLLFLATAIVWIRSHFIPDMAQYYKHRIVSDRTFVETQYSFSSANGGLSFGSSYVEFTSATPADSVKTRAQSGYTFDDTFRLIWFHPSWRRYGGMLSDHDFRLWSLGFQYRAFDTRKYGIPQPLQIGRSFTFSYALPLFLFSILPIRALRKWIKSRRLNRRLRLGLCPSCGYDLHQLTSSACPECGHAILPPV